MLIARKRFILLAQIDQDWTSPHSRTTWFRQHQGCPSLTATPHRSPAAGRTLAGFFSYSVTLLSIAYSLKRQDEIVVGYIVTTKSRQKLRVYYSFKFYKKINLSKLATVLTID